MKYSLFLSINMVWFLLILLAVLFEDTMAEDPDHEHSEGSSVIQTKSGPIAGTVSQIGNGKEVNVFFGIPYAEPPVGNLRFKPPKMIEPWKSVLQAVKPSAICYQTIPSGFLRERLLSLFPRPWSEDCLTLNIWSPRPKSENVPVVFFIHGGGYSLGSSTIHVDGATMAYEGNVIVVTINYRLGVFGFFNLGTEDVSGNAGLMDQHLALLWVKDNIDAFGGNPEAITLMGISAGSASVGLHLLAPKSSGLFQKAIMMSGSPTNYWAIAETEQMIKHSKEAMSSLVCQLPNPADSLLCMQNKHPEDILDAVRDDHFLNMKFVPTIDGHYITEHPWVSAESGRFNPADVIIGTTRDEGTPFLTGVNPGTFSTNDGRLFRRDFRRIIKGSIEGLSDLQSEAVDVTYTDWANPDDPLRLRDAAKAIYGDALFNCDINEFADKLSQTEATVYRYVYAYEGAALKMLPLPSWSGVVHGQDHFPVLGPTQILKFYPRPDEVAAERFRKHFLNFIKKGDPNVKESGYPEDPEWPRYDNKRSYLQFAEKSSILSNFRQRECSTWLKLIPILQEKKC